MNDKEFDLDAELARLAAIERTSHPRPSRALVERVLEGAPVVRRDQVLERDLGKAARLAPWHRMLEALFPEGVGTAVAAMTLCLMTGLGLGYALGGNPAPPEPDLLLVADALLFGDELR
ncbi:MAG: hypothetical protein AAGI34_18220 [Pseudomonadota bacterium]